MDLKKNGIKVTVVVAVYNSERYLRQTLDSILAQTLQEIEIICVDDGSVDSSLSILKKYACLDDRLIVLEQTEQSDGAGKARNLGLIHAHGQYLAFLDSDDFFEPDMLEKAYDKAIKTQSDIVIYDGYEFDEKTGANKEAGFILRREYLPKDKDVFAPEENKDLIFQMTLGAAWNCLIRKEFISEYNLQFQSFHHADDLGFVYAAFACAARIAVLKERLIHYRINNPDSQAANIGKWPEAACPALLQLKNELTVKGLYEKFKVSFVQEVIIYMVFYLDEVKNYAAFLRLYHEFKEKYYEALDLSGVPENRFSIPYWVTFRNAFRDMNAGEYLYSRMYGLTPFKSQAAWKGEIPVNAKVVVYGAGKIGTGIFSEIMQEKNYKVLAWVDAQYEKIGYPVVAPEEIKTLDFDFVLVAVESESLYQDICQYLRKWKVSESKICWTAKN